MSPLILPNQYFRMRKVRHGNIVWLKSIILFIRPLNLPDPLSNIKTTSRKRYVTKVKHCALSFQWHSFRNVTKIIGIHAPTRLAQALCCVFKKKIWIRSHTLNSISQWRYLFIITNKLPHFTLTNVFTTFNVNMEIAQIKSYMITRA